MEEPSSPQVYWTFAKNQSLAETPPNSPQKSSEFPLMLFFKRMSDNNQMQYWIPINKNKMLRCLKVKAKAKAKQVNIHNALKSRLRVDSSAPKA